MDSNDFFTALPTIFTAAKLGVDRWRAYSNSGSANTISNNANTTGNSANTATVVSISFTFNIHTGSSV